jgi:Arc/MetJ-type ribon-helix-helix transcriptional regulator
MDYPQLMEVDVTPDQQALIRHAIAAGRVHTAEEAVQEALSLWEIRERGRAEFVSSLDQARASITRGDGIPITQESMLDLAKGVKRRGRERLAAERRAAV